MQLQSRAMQLAVWSVAGVLLALSVVGCERDGEDQYIVEGNIPRVLYLERIKSGGR